MEMVTLSFKRGDVYEDVHLSKADLILALDAGLTVCLRHLQRPDSRDDAFGWSNLLVEYYTTLRLLDGLSYLESLQFKSDENGLLRPKDNKKSEI